MDGPLSPTTSKAATQFDIHEDSAATMSSSASGSRKGSNDARLPTFTSQRDLVKPLSTSKINSQQLPLSNLSPSRLNQDKHINAKEQENDSPIDKLLRTIALKGKQGHGHEAPRTFMGPKDGHSGVTTDKALVTKSADAVPIEVVDNLKKQLEDAQAQLARMDLKLSQQRGVPSMTVHANNTHADTAAELRDATQQLLDKLDHVPAQVDPPGYSNDARLNHSRGVSPQPLELYPGAWNSDRGMGDVGPAAERSTSFSGWPHPASHEYPSSTYSRPPNGPQQHRLLPQRYDDYPTPSSYASASFDHQGPLDQNFRVGTQFNRWPGAQAALDTNSAYPRGPAGFSPPITPTSLTSGNPGPAIISYPSRIPGTGLSPTAAEFNVDHLTGNPRSGSNPWNAASGSMHPTTQHYMAPVEPINYRRLLDRNTTCNWDYIVEKIVCSNDQQASIFLQQKLKISSPEQKYELVEAIIHKAYPLMINRFGNFLIQRCFEHGTPEQVVAIASAIRGKTLDLSMDAFGCHVVQKAFDVVPEQYKAIMVHELLRRIPETVVHRYACHVWQKLFELRWSDSPPQIMKYVNEALRGMWHEVALGETGSLVVQNIFENCLEEDKRPCISEVLANIDIVSHGQFGNWCIQHVCEHGAPSDKSCAIEHVLQYATEYSTDQFASKVVEKCLKVGGPDFLDRYLDKICEGRPDRPRMPLIDISGDQYGNYLVQYILIHAEPHHREAVSQNIRKHMVSLRGSKFGSRVAMLCTNPTIHTRPGPPMTMPLNSHERFFFHGNNPNVPSNAHSFGQNNIHRQGFR